MNRDIMWAPSNEPGFEHLRLAQDEEDIVADGVVIGIRDGVPFRAHYLIRCDWAWSVLEVSVQLLDGSERALELRTDGKGRWRGASGERIALLNGCVDVDISVTPFTNTLPIRRLALRPGGAADLTVAYINVPELQVEAAPQRYTYLESTPDGGLYRYESGSFKVELPVDSDGLVIDYPGYFTRVWPG